MVRVLPLSPSSQGSARRPVLSYCMVAASMEIVDRVHISDAGVFGRQQMTPAVDIEYFENGGRGEGLGAKAKLETGSVSPMAIVKAVHHVCRRSMDTRTGFACVNLKHLPNFGASPDRSERNKAHASNLHVFANPSFRDDGEFPPFRNLRPDDHSVYGSAFVDAMDLYLPRSANDIAVYTECVPGGTATAALAISLCLGACVSTPSSSVDEGVRSAKHRLVSERFQELSSEFDRLLLERRVEEALSLCCDGFQYHMVLWLLSLPRRRNLLPEGGKILLGGGSQMLSVMILLRRLLGETEEWGWLRDRIRVVTTTWVHDSMAARGAAWNHPLAEGVALLHPEFRFRLSGKASLRKYDQGYTQEGCGAGALLYVAKHRLGLSDEELTLAIERSLDQDLPDASLSKSGN